MTLAASSDGVSTGGHFTHPACLNSSVQTQHPHPQPQGQPQTQAQPPVDLNRSLWRAARRHPLGWVAAAVVMLAAALIATLYSVLLHTVLQSDRRRQEAAVHADAHWRCHNERSLAQRRRCLAQIDAALSVDAKTPVDTRR